MVLVEDDARVLEVEVVLGGLVPGQGEDPLEVAADDAVLGGRGRELGEPVELAARGAVGLLGEVGLLDLSAELRDLGLLLVAFPELILDRLQLLAEEVLALGVLHLRLHLGLDLRAELEHLELAVEDDGELAEARLDVRLLEQLLLLGRLEAHRRRDQVRERARVLGVRGGKLQLVGQIGDEADHPAEKRLDVAAESLDLGLRAVDVREVAELADEVGVALDDAFEPHPAHALDEDSQRPVGDADHLVDERRGSDVVDVLGAVRLFLGVPRRHERDRRVVRDRFVDELDRPLLAYCERGHGVGEDHRLLERQDREDLGDGVLFGAHGFFDRAHASSVDRMVTLTAAGALRASGRWMERRPFSYVAFAASESTSSFSCTRRSKMP